MGRSFSVAALSGAGLFIGLGAANPAHAGAWTEKAGEGKAILSVRAASADEAFDARGKSTLASDFRKHGADL
jgi:hypothetical protein